MMRALLPHLVLGLVLLWSSVCDIDASAVDDDGSGRIWKPTPEHPLPVSSVVEFMHSGNLGLNNVLWMNVAATASGGCSTNQEHEKKRMDGSNRTAPLTFGVVILPPIRTDLGKKQDVEMHQYSELFDLEHQQQFYMKHRNCYITDKINFERQQKDGSLQVLKDVVTKKIVRRPPFTVEDKHHFYQGLELSQRLLEKYYEPCVAKMRRIFQHGESFYTTLHMRVEDDWAFYCKQKEYYSNKRNEPEKWCFGALEIANITLASEEIRGHHNFLLLYAGDKFDAKNRNRRTDSMRADPTTVWPKDVRIANPTHMGCFDQGEPSYSERSAVSMFLAADADVYVGTMKSSFFQGVSTIRGLSRPFSGHAYAYDGDSPEYKHLKEYHPQIPFSPWPED